MSKMGTKKRGYFPADNNYLANDQGMISYGSAPSINKIQGSGLMGGGTTTIKE
jgi:hypothetical protein